MAALSPNRIRWRYTYADGSYYILSAQKAITDQVNAVPEPKVGGSAADGSEEVPPQGFKPRRANYVDANGHKRAVICYDTACDAWTLAGSTLNLNYNNDSVVYTRQPVLSRVEQRWPRRAVISQDA